jgi:ABC-type multidrug transport system fused ATPase/permease subunit
MHPGRKHALKLIAKAYGERKTLFATVVVAALVGASIDLIAPLVLRQIIDGLNERRPADEIVRLIGWLVAWQIGRFLAWRVCWTSANAAEMSANKTLWRSTFADYLSRSYRFFADTPSGVVTHKLANIGVAATFLLDTAIETVLVTAVVMTGSIIAFYRVSPWLALGFVLAIAGYVALTLRLDRGKRLLDDASNKAKSEMKGTVADAFTNAIVVKLFGGAKMETERVGSIVDTWTSLKLKAWNRGEAVSSVVTVGNIFMECGVLLYAVHQWAAGVISIGTVVLLHTYAKTTGQYLKNIRSGLRRIDENLSEAGESADILLQPQDIVDRPGAKLLKATHGAVSFRDVRFGFGEKSPNVLRGFSLDIAPGEKVALVGPSGAGKSTVTRLLFRFYDVDRGVITIDGQDIAAVTQDSLRASIALVPQDPTLFHRSLMDNIRYAKPRASDKAVIAAAKAARCHEFISNLADGYDSMVGERGIKLSGGERQRVSIARAILKDAPILILDEATSALDSESERAIHEALGELMAKKTVIAIAHRLSTIMDMDRIVVVERGKVAASGTHEELLRDVGTYAKLWNIQAGGYK